MDNIGWQVQLARVPGRRVVAQDFSMYEAPTLRPGAGEVLPRTEALGLNAGLRHRLGTGRSTTLGPALEPGDVPRSDGVATVVDSTDPSLPVGSRVVGLIPWAGHSAIPVNTLRVVDESHSVEELLTLRGHVGLTAYAALTRVGGLRPGLTVWISAAAGGVGTCGVQLARALGGRVIASAGGAERVGFLRRQLGLDHVLDRTGDLAAGLDELAPDGLDLYLDLVGADHLSTALPRMRSGGRIVLLGATADAASREVVVDSTALVRERQTIAGMSVVDHADALPDLNALVDEAHYPALQPVSTVSRGPEALGEAFAALFDGGILGRAIVDVRKDGAPHSWMSGVATAQRGDVL